MPNKLVVVYLERKDYEYVTKLEIPLHDTFHPVFFVAEGNMLNVLDNTNTWHYIPLSNVKEYWREASDAKA